MITKNEQSGRKLKKKLTHYWKKGDIALHNKPDDCWVSINGLVLDITSLVQEYKNRPEVLPLLAEAGKDISHWFDEDGNIRTYIHPILGTRVAYLPHGAIPHTTDINLPSTEWKPVPINSWWKNPDYIIGRLTKSARPIKIYNNLTKKEITLTVCAEETINEILTKYSQFNSNARSYEWRCENKILNMNKTLEENGIPDRKAELQRLGLPDDMYVPTIRLYFNDVI